MGQLFFYTCSKREEMLHAENTVRLLVVVGRNLVIACVSRIS